MRAVVLIAGLTFRQLTQRRRLWILLALTAGPALLYAVAATTAPKHSLPDIYHGLNAGLLLVVTLPVASLLNGGAAFGEERRSGTLPYLVVKPLPRWLVAVSVIGGTILATLAVGGVGIALGWLIAGLAAGDWSLGVASLAGLVVEAIGYSAVFVPLGLLLQRATLVGLVYIFLWEAIFARVLSAVSSSSISLTGLSAYVPFTDSIQGEFVDMLGNIVPGAGGALFKVAALSVISVGVTTWALIRRDLA